MEFKHKMTDIWLRKGLKTIEWRKKKKYKNNAPKKTLHMF